MDKLACEFLLYNSTLSMLARHYDKKPSTLNGIILNRIKRLPSVFEAAKQHGRGSDCSVLALDTLYAQNGESETIVLYVANAMTGAPLYCGIIKCEDAQTIASVLEKLREELHCNPKVVVCDKGPALLKAIKNVFPNSLIQACVFHALKSLNHDLRTDGRVKGTDVSLIALRKKVKQLLTIFFYAEEAEKRGAILEELRRLDLDLDEEACGVVERFLRGLDLYNPLGTLQQVLGIDKSELRRVIYNNLCEAHFNLLEQQGKKQRGWKSSESVRLYANAFWYYRLMEQEGAPIKNSNYRFTLPSTLVHPGMASNEIDQLVAYGISRELVHDSLRKLPTLNIGKLAITSEQMDAMKVFVNERSEDGAGFEEFISQFSLAQHDRSDIKKLIMVMGFRFYSSTGGRIVISR